MADTTFFNYRKMEMEIARRQEAHDKRMILGRNMARLFVASLAFAGISYVTKNLSDEASSIKKPETMENHRYPSTAAPDSLTLK